MAKKLDDDEFWLPSEFLTDEDLLMDYRTENDDFKVHNPSGISNGFVFRSDLKTDLCSPVEFAETDSDEDEYVNGLTRDMKKASLQSSVKGQQMYGSPQSALSDYGFSNASSQKEAIKTGVDWNLLYAAAEEVARLKMVEELASIPNFIPQPQKTAPTMRNPSPAPSLYLLKSQNEARLAYLQLQVSQFQRMKQHQQQLMKQGIWGDFQYLNDIPAGRTPITWPNLQQSAPQRRLNLNVSLNQGVFLGENGGLKRERNGTGVFLPRRNAAPAVAVETRKKPAAVHLPEKVHPMNLNLETPYGVQSLKTKPNLVKFAATANQEVRLPPEWSY